MAWAAKGAGTLAVALGVATGYLSLLPRITISQNQALDPMDPFSAPFVVSNDGPLGINKVVVLCMPIKVEDTAHNLLSRYAVKRVPTIPGMEVGEKATVPCYLGVTLTHPIETADIAFRVQFRPDFVIWRVHRDLRFSAMRGADGKLYWYPQPFDRMPDESIFPPLPKFTSP